MNTSMNLQRISVDRLKPAKYNPRKDLKPGDPAYEKIRRSLQRCRQRRYVFIWGTSVEQAPAF